MNKNDLGDRVKAFRTRKGMSQEVLADESGLSLRTVQRIENGESNPTGESLKRLANALGILPDDLLDWSVKEDKKFLIYLNISALSFLLFPILGITIPFILWSSKKGKIRNIDNLGKALINFQITWTMLLFFIPVLLLILSKVQLIQNLTLSSIFLFIGVWYLFNLSIVLLNTIRIGNGNHVVYGPKINFLK